MWKAFYIDSKSGKKKSSALTKDMVTIAEKIVPVYFEKLEATGNFSFTVESMVSWIKINYTNVAPFVSKTPRSQVKAANPGKTLLDVQYLCYHLSRPQSYAIEDERTGVELAPLTRTGRNEYELKKLWQV